MESLPVARKRRLSSTQRQIRERREQVFRYLLQGLTQQEIADALNVSQPLISSDVKVLQKEANDTLHELIESTLPYQFYKTEQVVQEVARQAWLLFHDSSDPFVKLRALKEIREAQTTNYLILRGGRGLLQAQRTRREVADLRSEAEDWKSGRRWREEDLPAESTVVHSDDQG